MKKLSLLFLTLCISLAGWAATSVNADSGWKHSNPFAYGLKSSLSDDHKTLSLTYSLNASAIPANNSNYDYSNLNSTRGVQIYIVNKETGQRVKTITSGPITRGTWTVNVSTDDLPRDVELTWEVVVNGNKGRTKPQIIGSSGKNPVNAHGIGINTDPTHPNFGQIFVSEGYPSSVDQKNSLLEFDPQLQYVQRHVKQTHIVNSTNTSTTSYFSGALNYEPHRVKTTADGRVFVTCYHPTAGGAVLEYLGNNTFKNVIDFDKTKNQGSDAVNSEHSRRVIGMDVKGTGDELKIVLAWIDANGYTFTTNSQPGAKIMVYEYALGEAEKDGVVMPLPQVIGTSTSSAYVKYIGEENDWQSSTASGYSGLLYQGFRDGWNSCLRGFVDVAYGKNNDIWMKIDYGSYATHPGRIILFRPNGNSVAKITEVLVNNEVVDGSYDDYFGGNALIYDDYYYGSSNKGSSSLIAGFSLGKIKGHKIEIADDATTKPSKMFSGQWEVANTESNSANRIGYWVTAFARDYAGNLYALTERRDDYAGSTADSKSFNANILCIAMPYSGQRITRANSTFTISNPVPNILATDLRYDIVRGKNQYEFSFNVNTKPQEAQIRFYESYDAMKNSLNAVNADNYDGTNNNKPLFVYNIPSDKLKQGRIAVNLGAVGGQVDANGVITNDRLPAGVLYWSVYVKTRESNAFGAIYKQSTTGEDAHYRLHATVNNYPETDQFGQLYAVNYYAGGDARNGLMVYGFNPDGKSNDEQNNILNSYRYKLVKNYLNPTGSKPKFTNQRRLDVAPDGKVYIADCGSSLAFNKTAARPWLFTGGGVFVWNPNTQTGDEIQISQFLLDKTETSTAVTIYNHGGQMKLYATNTYGEFDNHANKKNYWNDKEYTEANQADVKIYGWNGFKEYTLGTPENILLQETSGTVQRSLGMGDGNGNISIVATDKGIWMAQHREGDVKYSLATSVALPDVPSNYILSFIPYNSNTRTWRSCTNIGTGSHTPSANSQTENAPLQSCPGAGLAYRKVNNKEYLYIVQHSGDIAQFEIRSWNGTTPSVYHVRTYPSVGNKTVIGHGTNTETTRPTGTITSMCFDYAGNLITTAGQTYFKEGMGSQDIVVYTMPYDRVNAREIQAPNSCRMIPERIAHLDMDKEGLDELIKEHKIDHPEGCAIDLYRPIQGGEFNTICLPCTLDLKTLPEDHPLYEAELKEYKGLNLNTVGGEKVLELVFTDVSDRVIIANKPYIIQPEENYNSIIRFAGPLQLTNTTGEAVNHEENSKNYNITYQGIIPYQEITPFIQDGVSLTLMLVADNRLAEMTTRGYMYGFRGYFQLNQPLPKGMQTRITTSKGTTTNTTIVVDGKKVNVEKFLQEGRVYIRVGEDLYNIDGQKVE